MRRPTTQSKQCSGADELQARAAVRIEVRGQVQGVGFRPFVYRLAKRFSLGGSVRNTPTGVVIESEGKPDDIARFQDRIVAEAPDISIIEAILVENTTPRGSLRFTIESSDFPERPQARIPRDLAVCADCRSDVFAPGDRRRNYPFTNCTACGPRFSIIEATPYDRHATAMRRFDMCVACSDEYHAPSSRRFHAQPNACPSCGPQAALWDGQGRAIAGPEAAVTAAAALLRAGRIIALKGIGGFQLLARADRNDSIQRLRQRKNRPTKPLAVMVRSIDDAERLAELDFTERHVLESPQNPIVLAKSRRGALVDDLAPRVGTIGMMLPTTPLHELLLAELGTSVVATSGNRSDEPIAIDEREAVSRLSGIADAFLVHDRPVVHAVDDSVVRVIAGRPTVFRLARGYAPLPLPTLEAICSPPILAVGGHQKSAIAFWSGAQAILGRHIGDLDDQETRDAFAAEVSDLSRLYQFKSAAVACDLHPDYFTSRWTQGKQTRTIAVQHHHAHAVACMTEHDLLDRELLALVWDGTGYGLDGTIWGGECLRVRRNGFERVASLLTFPLPGGEAAVRHPNRAAFGLLHALFGEERVLRERQWMKRLELSQADARLLASMIRCRVNTPWTSSVGRLFDAIAALLLGIRDVSYEGEAAIQLEAVADSGTAEAYDLPTTRPGEGQSNPGDRCCSRGDWRPLLSAVLADVARDADVGVVAGRFHNALALWTYQLVAQQPHLDVVLSGGCFQNKLLTERIMNELGKLKRRVFMPHQVPMGDGGLAVGQLAVALGVGGCARDG